MKTIFITSFHLLISRNILATPILDLILARGDTRVILLVPEQKAFFFKDQFSSPGIIIEGVSAKRTSRDGFLRYLALAALDTKALAIKRKTELDGSGTWLVPFVGNRRFFHRAIRALDPFVTPKSRAAILFDRYHPDIIFATDIQNEHDIRFVHEAKRRSVPAIGMVRSWDNLTSKGILRVFPDLLLVHNEIVKAEAITYSGFPEERIRVVGIPHYDEYIKGRRASREEFFRKIGGDAKRRLILFAPVGNRYLRGNTVDKEIVEIIAQVMPPDCQLLVRLPPTDNVDLRGLKPDTRVIFERPTTHDFSPRNTELTREADQHLADTLFYSDLVIAGPSTICVDGALFNKPVILTGFDGYAKREYYESVVRYYDYEHWRQTLSSGGVRFVKNPSGLEEWTLRYLKNPGEDEEGRARIVRDQCFRCDGRSSEYVATILLSQLESSNS